MAISIGFKQRIILASTLLLGVSLLVSNWVSYSTTRAESVAEVERNSHAVLKKLKKILMLGCRVVRRLLQVPKAY